MAENSIGERFIGLQVRLREVELYIREANMTTHYDLTNTVYEIMGNAISTCHTILQQTKSTIFDCQDEIKKLEQDHQEINNEKET